VPELRGALGEGEVAVVMFWGEERKNKNGVELPLTTVKAGSLTLTFAGRPGSCLRRAVKELEQRSEEESAEEMLRLHPAPSDPRD
jgi:hypothetical protein